MTFVRAVLVPGVGVHMASDWEVTDPGRSGPAGYKDGILKLLIFDSSLAIAFSGAIDAALDGASSARDAHASGGSTEAIVALLTAYSGGHDCSFIVATSLPALYEIKDGQARLCTAAWLGDQRALEVYQAAFASAPDHSSMVSDEDLAKGRLTREGLRVATAHGHAFTAAIQAGLPGVGLVSIEVIPTHGLVYGTQMQVYFPEQAIPENTPTTLRFGTAAHGGFIVSTMGAENGPAAALYFPHGKFGVFSSPLSLPQTVTIHAATQDEFVAQVSATYGFVLKPGLSVG